MNEIYEAIEILDNYEHYIRGSLRDNNFIAIIPLLKEALQEKLEREKESKKYEITIF